MRKNKGFSLVELIIVIAIMAILIGVMAPQLIKYIEKSKVSSDTQLCGTVQTAIVTAMSDPEVNDATDYDTTVQGWTNTTVNVSALTTTTAPGSAALETLGESSGANVNSSLKSYNAKKNGVKFDVLDGNFAGNFVLDGDFAVGSLHGHQVIIAKEAFVDYAVFDLVFVGRTACDDGRNCDEADGAPCCCDADFVDCFHFERGFVDDF